MRKFEFLTLFVFALSLSLFSQTKTGTKTGTKRSPEKEKATPKPFKGKLMIEFYGQTAPLVNASVSMIKDGKIDSTSIAHTDKYGDFEITPKSSSGNYGLSVTPATKEVTNIVLATQQGVEIARMKRGPNGFEYKLIPADIVKLTEMEVSDDITLTIDKFKSGSKTSLQVIENINYRTDEFKLDKSMLTTIDKVVKIMKDNTNLKLEIISHTDAKGDDKFNLLLSQKRAQAVVDYIIAQGIGQERLKSSGKGETVIRNRCENKIDCTEKEHAYNRRTEFNFSK
ncbi:MAG: OmpA/MotB domain protein [Bacteroidota bacterium]|jgi:outer membrane protein OmpA-like peptidoglycan-associated protein|nr:OmpA/MotB domain protein [Bacteroidota bacterium]